MVGPPTSFPLEAEVYPLSSGWVQPKRPAQAELKPIVYLGPISHPNRHGVTF